MSDVLSVNIDVPRWDQNTYIGRAKHFFNVTNPLNLFHSPAELEKAKEIVQRKRNGELKSGEVSIDELYRAKNLYDSAFHPVTGESVLLIGRMSAQVPMNMLITGCMMTFYRSTPAVVFWQWVNQSFNAVVNYCNRSGADMPVSTIGKSYAVACGGAVATALALNKMVVKAPPIIGRFVPFAAVAAANCVNIPAMRSKELSEGIKVTDEEGNAVGVSRNAATEATIAVIISRIIMAAPGMTITPLVINSLDRRGVFKGKRWMEPTLQILFTGLVLTFATPLACALFVQRVPIKVDKLEPDLQDKIKKMQPSPEILYYNKGL